MAMPHMEDHRNHMSGNHPPPSRAPVPIRLIAATFPPDDALSLLAEVLDEYGRIIAAGPCDTMRQSGRVGWLADGSPVIWV
jgi:hypothetical protein